MSLKDVYHTLTPAVVKREMYYLRRKGLPLYLKDQLVEIGARFEVDRKFGDYNTFQPVDGVAFRFYPEFKDTIRARYTSASGIREFHAFVDVARDKTCLFDAGAGRGLFSLIFCSLTGGTAFCFDPSHAMIADLRRNAELNAGFDMRAREFGVGEASRRQSFVHIPDGQYVLADDDRKEPAVMAEIRTIDEVVREEQVRPDLIKLDVEGFELLAIQGASDLLAEHTPTLFMEIHPDLMPLRDGVRTIFDNLSGFGYAFYGVDLEVIANPVAHTMRSREVPAVVHILAKAQ